MLTGESIAHHVGLRPLNSKIADELLYFCNCGLLAALTGQLKTKFYDSRGGARRQPRSQ